MMGQSRTYPDDAGKTSPALGAPCFRVTFDADGDFSTEDDLAADPPTVQRSVFLPGVPGDDFVAKIQLPLPAMVGVAPLIDGRTDQAITVTVYEDPDGDGTFAAASSGTYTLVLQVDCGALHETLGDGDPFTCAGGADTTTLTRSYGFTASAGGTAIPVPASDFDFLVDGNPPLPVSAIHVWVQNAAGDQSNFAVPTAVLLAAGGAAAAPLVDAVDEVLWHPVLLVNANPAADNCEAGLPPCNTPNYHVQLEFNPPLQPGERFTFNANDPVVVTATLFDGAGAPKNFAPDGANLVINTLSAVSSPPGANVQRIYHVDTATDTAIFTVPQADLFVGTQLVTGWELHVESYDVSKDVPGAPPFPFPFSYYNAVANQVFGTSKPVADTLDAFFTPVFAVNPAALPLPNTVSLTTLDGTGQEESADPVTFQFARTGDKTFALLVDYQCNSSLGGPSSCPVAPNPVEIPAGQATGVLIITPPNDAVLEGDETLTIQIVPPPAPPGSTPVQLSTSPPGTAKLRFYTIGAPSSATATITEVEAPAVEIAIVSVSSSVLEDTPGGHVALKVSRTFVGGPLTVALTTVGSNALFNDYQLKDASGALIPLSSPSVQIADGSLLTTVRVEPIADLSYEIDETVKVTLATGFGYVLGASKSATVTILNDDKPDVSLEVLDPGVAFEGEAVGEPGTPVLTFRAHINLPWTTDLPVHIQVPFGADLTPDDVEVSELAGPLTTVSANVLVTIPTGQTSASFTVAGLGDEDVDEGDEPVLAQLQPSPTGAYTINAPNAEATGVIAEEPRPFVGLVGPSVAGVPVQEMDEDSSVIVTVFRVTGYTDEELLVPLATVGNIQLFGVSGGSCNLGAPLAGTVTIPTGGLHAELCVRAPDDSVVEEDEAARVRIVPSSLNANYFLLEDESTVDFVVVDDEVPRIGVAASDPSASEFNLDPAQFTVSRFGNQRGAFDVCLGLAGSATEGVDYVLRTVPDATITPVANEFCVPFAADQNKVLVTVEPKSDPDTADENVVVSLLADALYTVDPDALEATAEIFDKLTLTEIRPNSGSTAGGNTVQIIGSGFGPGLTVLFGSKASPSLAVVDSGLVLAQAPSGTGAVKISVQSGSAACTATSAHCSHEDVTYTYLVAPAITGITPSSGPTGGGRTVTIAGSGFATSGVSVLFGGVAATGVTSTGSSVTAVTPPHAAGAVDVEVINPDGLGGTKANAFTYSDGAAETPSPTPTPDAGTFTEVVAGLAAGETFFYRVLATEAGASSQFTGTFTVAAGTALESPVAAIEPIPAKVDKGATIEFAYTLPPDAETAKVQVLDADGNVVAEYTLTQNPSTGVWEGSGEIPDKGTFRIQVAYSTSTFALVTSDQGTVQSNSGSVTEAVEEHPVAIVAGAVGAAGLVSAALWAIRRRVVG